MQKLGFFILMALASSIMGCSTFKKMNYNAAIGVDYMPISEYAAQFVSGDLKPGLGSTGYLGIGRYGNLIDKTNISLSRQTSTFTSDELDTEMKTGTTKLYFDYYYTPEEMESYFAGVGFGRYETAFSGDSPEDGGPSITLRGGKSYRYSSYSDSVYFIRGLLTYVKSAEIRRFYFFGGKADVNHIVIGIQIGTSIGLFEKGLESRTPTIEPQPVPNKSSQEDS